MKHTLKLLIFALPFLIFLSACVPQNSPAPAAPAPPTPLPTPAQEIKTEVFAENLTIPWEIVFLPSGEMLVTERPGRLVKIGADRKVIPISGVAHRGEGGLLGLALHPDFISNNFVYLYLTSRVDGGLVNRVERYVLQEDKLSQRKVIVGSIPGASNHDGGRIAFGPDNNLYITTGDAGEPDRAQDKESLAGKILRITDEGNVPADNPFDNEVYSYGHRNSQGLAWDYFGNLLATEHGRSGVQSGFDELNLIEKGRNYGWPIIEGDETAAGMEEPEEHSGADTTWAPAAALINNDHIWFTGLRGEALYDAKISSERTIASVTPHLQGKFGRLRALTRGPDGALYVSTSNKDGRGIVRGGDDKIIKVTFTR